MAELNLVFTVLCQHCGRPLYGRVRFCPYCGKEESVTVVAGAATARHALELEAAEEGGTQILTAPPAAEVPWPQEQQVEADLGAAGTAIATTAAKAADSATSHFATADLDSQATEPAPSAPPEPLSAQAPPPGAVRKRPMIGKAVATALLLLALVLVPVQVTRQSADAPERASSLAQAQNRDDRSVTQRAVAALAAAYDAGARKVSAGLDWLVQERTDRREQPQASAPPRMAGKLEPDPAPAPAAQARESVPPAILTALPGPSETPVRKETTCSPALVALALCAGEPIAETAPETSSNVARERGWSGQ